GEIVDPTESPSDSSSCSIVTVAVDFPFVPTTCIAGYASWGSPRSVSRARMLSRPKPSRGHGLMASSHSTADMFLSVARGQLATVALELLPLGVDHSGWCIRHEALVREHPFRARHLVAQALDLSAAVVLDGRALRAHDGGEDPPLVVRAELDLH